MINKEYIKIIVKKLIIVAILLLIQDIIKIIYYIYIFFNFLKYLLSIYYTIIKHILYILFQNYYLIDAKLFQLIFNYLKFYTIIHFVKKFWTMIIQ